MTSARKVAIGVVAAVALLLASLVALPLLFRDRIVARIRAELAKSVDARVAWGGVSLGLLRDFPNVTLSVDDPSVVGVKRFAGDTLVALRRARLVLDAGSVYRHLMRGGSIVVREVALERPHVRLRVLADGTASWDIVRGDTATGRGGRDVGVTLRELRIADGSVALDNAQSRLAASVVGLDETLSGDFSQDRFALASRTRADSVSLSFAGVPYLTRTTVALDADVNADLPAHRFTLNGVTLRLNQLALAVAGTVTTGSPDVGLDLRFEAPSTAFRDILSLVPAVYRHDFDKLQTSGTMAVSGQVRGAFGERAFPAFALRAKVENGAFKYPTLPLPARGIFMDLALSNPGGSPDSTVVTMQRLRALIGPNPLEARLVVRTPVSDPDVDLRLLGTLDLAQLAQTVKLDGVSGLAGTVAANVAVRTRLSDVDARRYDRVAAQGTLNARRVAFKSKDLPHPVAVDTAALQLTPRAAELRTIAARLGDSDVRASVSLENLLGYALRGDELRGRGSVRSERLDLLALVPEESSSDAIPVPAGVDFTLDASAGRVTYGALVATNVRGDLRVKDRKVTLDSLRMDLLRGAVVASGFYETTNPDRPTFDAALRLAGVDVPTAFTSVATVQRLAPVARWAKGAVSGTLVLKGAMDQQMTPSFSTLAGQGDVDAAGLALEGVPALEKLADALSLEQVRRPALGDARVAFTVADGRVAVRPFTVRAGELGLTVGGTHGIDQSMRYDLALLVPRSLLRGAAGTSIARLAARVGKSAEADTGAAVRIGARLTGTVSSPKVEVSFAGAAASVREAARDAVQQQVAARVDVARARADSAAEAGRRRAREEAERAVAEAERQAARVREEARALAESIKRTAGARADSLAARATNPAAKLAARAAADRLKREADQQAERIVREADARADALVGAARARVDSLAPPKG